MSGTIDMAEYKFSLSLEDKNFTSGMKSAESNTESFQGKMGGMFGKLGGMATMAGGAIAVGLGAAIASGVKDAIDAQKPVAQLEAVLKSTGGAAGVTKNQVLGMSDALEQTTMFSAEAATEAQNLLLTFTNIGKDVFPQATKTCADMAQSLGGDMKGQSIALGKALNDPINGITALTRVGVTFTEGQKASIKAMQEHGNMAGAQKIILAELNKEFGGSAEAAGKTFAGQLEIAKAGLGAVTESIGSALLPTISSLLTWVNKNMPAIQATIEKVFAAIKTIVSSPMFQELAKAVGACFSAVFEFFKTWSVYLMKLGEDNSKAFEAIKTVIVTVLKIITDIIKVFTAFMSGDFKTMNAAIVDIVKNMWTLIKNLFTVAIEGIKMILRGAITIISQIGSAIMNGLWSAMKSIWSSITGWFSSAFNSLLKWIGSFSFASAGRNMFNTLWDGLKGIWGSIKSWVSDSIQWLKDKLSFWKSSQNTMSSSGGRTTGNVKLPSYDVGTAYVPFDQIALIHKGERVVTAAENRNYNSGGGGASFGDINLTVSVAGNIDRNVMPELKKMMKETASTMTSDLVSGLQRKGSMR